MSSQSALSYHEPDIQIILILSSFLLLLNAVNYILDRVLFCGLVGLILIGVAWGVPGANWLSQEAQDTIMQLGYLGLIMIVYEALSSLVACIGIGVPIGLSFILCALLPITSLQAFAAGAALCSTSLGTAFTVLSTSGLTDSRLGVVITSAAMMDDVVGLVMVQVISNLGQGSDFTAIPIVRPILVSIAFAVLVPALCKWAIQPTVRRAYPLFSSLNGKSGALQKNSNIALVIHTAILTALVAGATYAGTSNLFAAYLAGLSVTWLSDVLKDLAQAGKSLSARRSPSRQTAVRETGQSRQLPESSQCSSADDIDEEPTSGTHVYEIYYQPAVERILKPFFFASIGFSIPITQMFSAHIVWRGIVYSSLMITAKLVCGLCLARFATSAVGSERSTPGMFASWKSAASKESHTPAPAVGRTREAPLQEITRPAETHPPPGDQETHSTERETVSPTRSKPSRKRAPRTAPLSLYPAAILGSAMVARGEIGFLISAIAESEGVYGASDGASELFLVVTWAILVCTIVGPVTVGLMIKRVKRLQEGEQKAQTGKPDALGIWGVVVEK